LRTNLPLTKKIPLTPKEKTLLVLPMPTKKQQFAMKELPRINTSKISHLVRRRTSGSVSEPMIIQASPVGCGGRALFCRFLRRHSSTGGFADETLGDCVARGAVMVEVFAVELVQDWV
jgi:hypothetical protein